MNYTEVYFEPVDEQLSEHLIAELTLTGAESFWQDDQRLRAYFLPEDLNEKAIEAIYKRLSPKDDHLHYGIQKTTPDNWDVAQNDTFEPIVIADQCRICGNKAEIGGNYPYELVVNPKLSFGSGHHPSTALCLAMQLEMDFADKKVLDIGCGSGILAILAEKLGAGNIDAIDNNPWAIEVAKENLELNNSLHIQLQEADTSSAELSATYPIVLANLNASVLLSELPNISKYVEKGGLILISGYMLKDQEAIHELANSNNLKLNNIQHNKDWVAALFEKE